MFYNAENVKRSNLSTHFCLAQPLSSDQMTVSPVLCIHPWSSCPFLYLLCRSQTHFDKQTLIHSFLCVLGDQTISNVPISSHLQLTRHSFSYLLDILILLLTPHIHLKPSPLHFLQSLHVFRPHWPSFTAIHLNPLHTSYIRFPSTFSEAPLDINTVSNSLKFAQALFTLALYASSVPLPAPIVSLKYQNFSTHSIPYPKPSEVSLNTFKSLFLYFSYFFVLYSVQQWKCRF